MLIQKFRKDWCALVEAWCALVEAWCALVEAWCALVEAWCALVEACMVHRMNTVCSVLLRVIKEAHLTLKSAQKGVKVKMSPI